MKQMLMARLGPFKDSEGNRRWFNELLEFTAPYPNKINEI